MPEIPPRPPRPVANADLLDQLGLVHEASVHRHNLLDQRLDTFHGELSLIRASLSERPTAPSLPPVPKTSVQKLAGGALAGAKYGTLVIGVIGILAQVASIWYPSLTGPLQSLVVLLGGQ